LAVNNAQSYITDYYIGGIYGTYTTALHVNEIFKLFKHYDKTKNQFDGVIAKL